jgi:putative ABC transport system permease protein
MKSSGRVPRPRVMGLRASALVDLYRWHLHEHKMQELLAGVGISIGVALFFGVLVANSSLIGTASQLIEAVTGNARLQLAARSPEGFDQGTANVIGKLPGVQASAPLLRENAAVLGPRGREPVQLVGLTPSQLALQGTATRNLGAGALLLAKGVGLPSGIASDIGAQPGQAVTILAQGEAHRVTVRAVLGSQTVGAIANSPVVVALLPVAQRVTDMQGRITQVLVEPKPGADQLVERGLRTVAAGRLDVEPANHELAMLEATAKPTSQSSGLFAAVSAMVGFLLALNAVLLTVPERRRFVADLRQQGFSPRQVLVILASQAVMLGLAASLVGVALGDVLSRSLFHEVPSYLTFAFPIGTHPVIPLATVLLALGCGIVATALASLLPLVDLRRRSADAAPHDSSEEGHGIGKATTTTAGLVGCALVLAVSVLVLLAPDLSVLGGVLLAVAALCLVLPLYELVIRGLRPVSERMRGSMLALAVVELDATATRSVALAGIAAVAVYGMLAVQGARANLITGLDSAVTQYLNTADIWVTTDDNFLTIDGFRGNRAAAAIARAPGVTSVREYQGALLDVGTRRLWIRARPVGDSAMIQASQMLRGNLAEATRRLRERGWAAVSNGYAAEHGLHVGDTFSLPTPSGMARLRVAAITTNVGWPPGAITMNTLDYRHYWNSSEPTALEVNLMAGTTPGAGQRAVQHALGDRPGLLVETLAQRQARFDESARQGIKSLSQISTLLLAATALAIAAALGAAVLQRRARLALLKSEGFDSRQLWRSLLLESAILVGIGCLDGVILGVYGHALASRWLNLTVGFPAPFSLGLGLVILTVGIVTVIALMVVAVPGVVAARVSSSMSLQE